MSPEGLERVKAQARKYFPLMTFTEDIRGRWHGSVTEADCRYTIEFYDSEGVTVYLDTSSDGSRVFYGSGLTLLAALVSLHNDVVEHKNKVSDLLTLVEEKCSR